MLLSFCTDESVTALLPSSSVSVYSVTSDANAGESVPPEIFRLASAVDGSSQVHPTSGPPVILYIMRISSPSAIPVPT